jgi:hypothetical protein
MLGFLFDTDPVGREIKRRLEAFDRIREMFPEYLCGRMSDKELGRRMEELMKDEYGD